MVNERLFKKLLNVSDLKLMALFLAGRTMKCYSYVYEEQGSVWEKA